MECQFIGIDVAKDKFDVAIKTNDKFINLVFSRDEKGLNKFNEWLTKSTINPWCCMEATGHYSEEIANFLDDKKIKCSIINPMQIKNFARSKLLRNKNDILDSRVILDFAKTNEIREFKPRSKNQKEIKGLANLISTLKEQSVQFKNKLHSIHGELAKKYLIETLDELKHKIIILEKELDTIIKNDSNMSQ